MSPSPHYSSVKAHRDFIESKISKYDKEQERERLIQEISKLKKELALCNKQKRQLQKDLDDLSDVLMGQDFNIPHF